jgi:potassium-dependent mechanosensitive channel
MVFGLGRSFEMFICYLSCLKWIRRFVLCAALAGAVDGQGLPKALLSPAPLPPPTQTAPAPVVPVAPPDLTIPLPKIADRAEELDRLLREISKQLTSTTELLESNQKAKERSDEINERIRDADTLLAGTPNSLELQEEDRYWRALTQQYTGQRKLLATRAASLQERIQSLEVQQVQWQATLDAIAETKGIESVVDRIKQKLDEMRRVRAQAQEQLNLVLTLQNQISQQDQKTAEVLARLGAAQESLRSHVFERDAPPLWASRQNRHLDQPVASELQRAMGREFSGAGDFVQAEKLRLFGLVVVCILAFLAAIKLEHAACKGAWPDVPPEAAFILQRPWATALLAALLSAIGRVSSAPVGIIFVVLLLYMIVVLRLLPPLIHPGLLPYLWTLTAFSFVEGLHVATQLSPAIRRNMLALIVFAALVAFSWLARPAKMRALQLSERRRLWFAAGVRLGLVLLGSSLIANILGFVSLSQILAFGTLLGGFMAAVVYCTARIMNLILATLLCSPAARARPMNREAVLLWGKRLINLVGALLWFDSVFVLFTIHEAVAEALTRALAYPVGFGTVRITLGGVIGLLLIVFVGYAIATLARYALQRVMLTRFSLQRGLPYAASKVIYYVLIVLVFLAAMANAGIELNKFTVITGALGVGVGFGLQNVVNNFASGLILLFERPIRVDDTVEVGGLVGTVRRIGARSSTIQTFQGAEVIVPNSNLIANQVINWTLSSPWRRVDVPVGVAYGTDPERVIKLLVSVASEHVGVMRSPEPTAFFLGFGDSALNFELRFWAARQEIWFQLKSDVSVDVAKALGEAGIEIPFPQRDLHVRSIDASVREAISPPPDRAGSTG